MKLTLNIRLLFSLVQYKQRGKLNIRLWGPGFQLWWPLTGEVVALTTSKEVCVEETLIVAMSNQLMLHDIGHEKYKLPHMRDDACLFVSRGDEHGAYKTGKCTNNNTFRGIYYQAS